MTGIDDFLSVLIYVLGYRLQVLDHIGADPAGTIMFEDSLKNIKTCKELGIGTGESSIQNSFDHL